VVVKREGRDWWRWWESNPRPGCKPTSISMLSHSFRFRFGGSEWQDNRSYRRLMSISRPGDHQGDAAHRWSTPLQQRMGTLPKRRWRLTPWIRQPCGTKPRRHFSSAGWIYVQHRRSTACSPWIFPSRRDHVHPRMPGLKTSGGLPIVYAAVRRRASFCSAMGSRVSCSGKSTSASHR